jgi:predicted sulfurtransferase
MALLLMGALAGASGEGTRAIISSIASSTLRDLFVCLGPLHALLSRRDRGLELHHKFRAEQVQVTHEQRLERDGLERSAAVRRQRRAWLRVQRRERRGKIRLSEHEAETSCSGLSTMKLWHMVSFYRLDQVLHEPFELANSLKRAWVPLGILGRVYVAEEGINAQLAVPDVSLEGFRKHVRGHNLLRDVFLNFDLPVDNDTQGENSTFSSPFTKLSVKVRPHVLADGLGDQALNWTNNGRKMSPHEFQEALGGGESPIVLDIRNRYETDIGMFDGATALQTDTFRETWGRLEKLLDGVARDRQILTYCTGGIRCAKANAYIVQKLGHHPDRVAALDGKLASFGLLPAVGSLWSAEGRVCALIGGIIHYAKYLRDCQAEHSSLFKGCNHVFDQRNGRPVGVQRIAPQVAPCSARVPRARALWPRDH